MQQQLNLNNSLNDFIIIIQARMGSTRFSGKSFHLINGTPSLEYLIQGLTAFFDKKKIIVATSINIENKIIRDFCSVNEINCFSGDEMNVASRFFEILSNRKCEYFIRINGDSPLFCPYELLNFINSKKKSKDFYSTVLFKSYPKGVNFEVVKSKIFLDNYSRFRKKEHFEHVTNYFYEYISSFSHENIFFKEKGYEELNFCFDTKEDLFFLEKMFNKMNIPHYNYKLKDKCELAIEINNSLRLAK